MSLQVPADVYAAYQYYNEPLTSEPTNPKNPLQVLLHIARPEDFVALKLDIDQEQMESDLLEQILSDSRLSSLVDELYWEPHFQYQPLVKCCWGTTAGN